MSVGTGERALKVKGLDLPILAQEIRLKKPAIVNSALFGWSPPHDLGHTGNPFCPSLVHLCRWPVFASFSSLFGNHPFWRPFGNMFAH